MACRTIELSPGVTVVACSRGSGKRCSNCGRDATKRCDFPLAGAKAGKTCDAWLCATCASPQGVNVDYCPPHARAKDQALRDRARQPEGMPLPQGGAPGAGGTPLPVGGAPPSPVPGAPPVRVPAPRLERLP